MIKNLRVKTMSWVFCGLVSAATFTALKAQNRTLTGKVVSSEDSSPLPGVSIAIKGTSQGTTTDLDGNYQLNVEENQNTLVFSFVGYISQEIEIGVQSIINVKLDADVKSLKEILVVGYGTQTKKESIGSIVKINNDKIMDMPVPSFEAALQGKAPGIQVIQSSGIAGSGSVIRIRGIGSVSAGGDPLYVVDGIPITQDPFLNGDRGGQNNNPLSTINPNDIESIDVLKDASAAGIYGSRGANGVILITTKRGKTGKPSFNFSTRAGISTPSRKIKFLDSKQWLQLYQEAWDNDGKVGVPTLPGGLTWAQAENTDTDWIKETTQIGFKQEYNLSVSQGTKKLKSYLGASYSDNGSFIKGNHFKRLSGRANLDYNILSNLKVGISTSLAQGRNFRAPTAWDGGLGAAQSTALPIFPVYNSGGSYFTGSGSGNNPTFVQEYKQWQTRELRTINNAYVDFEPIKHLSIRITGAIDYMDLSDYIYEAPEYDLQNHIPRAKLYPTWILNRTGTATISYNPNLGEKQNLTFLAGTELQKSTTTKYDEITYTNVSDQIYKNPSASTSPKTDTIRRVAPTQVWSFLSYFGRVNYMLKDRYIIQATGRVDGSSRFGTNNRYGFFPTVALGYILSEENFLKNSRVINFLKLKASWGITGTADIPNYTRFGTFQLLESKDQYNNQPVIIQKRLDNPDLAWEKVTTIDGGIEIGLWKGRVTSELSFYNKLSKDVLIDALTPSSSGFDRYFQNIGTVLNRGVEFSISSKNLVGTFKWSTDFNIARNHNEVISTGNTDPDAISGSGDTRVVPGLPVGSNYLVRFSHVDQATGRPVYLDKDGNETFTFDLKNRVPVGSVVPDFIGGITNTFQFKGFDLSFLIAFTYGGNIYDDAAKRQLGVFKDWNMRQDLLDRWRQPGDDAKYPRLTTSPSTYGLGNEWNYNNTLFLYDASFIRMRNITLGYTFSPTFVKRLHLTQLRVYATATNVFTLSKYPGWDPEIVRDHNGSQGRNISPNVTYLTAPQERSYSIGLNLNF